MGYEKLIGDMSNLSILITNIKASEVGVSVNLYYHKANQSKDSSQFLNYINIARQN